MIKIVEVIIKAPIVGPVWPTSFIAGTQNPIGFRVSGLRAASEKIKRWTALKREGGESTRANGKRRSA